jgi:hypothetical protein
MRLTVRAFFKSLNTKDIIEKYLVIIFLGVLMFYFADQEIVDPGLNTVFILILSFGKTIFFVVQSLRKINHVIDKNVAYFRFLIFMTFHILTIVISFGVDFFCLYTANPDNFQGVSPTAGIPELLFEFIYLSMLAFNNLGFYDVTPVSMVSKVLVMTEILIYYFTIVLILSDFVSLRDSVLEERLGKK